MGSTPTSNVWGVLCCNCSFFLKKQTATERETQRRPRRTPPVRGVSMRRMRGWVDGIRLCAVRCLNKTRSAAMCACGAQRSRPRKARRHCAWDASQTTDCKRCAHPHNYHLRALPQTDVVTPPHTHSTSTTAACRHGQTSN